MFHLVPGWGGWTLDHPVYKKLYFDAGYILQLLQSINPVIFFIEKSTRPVIFIEKSIRPVIEYGHLEVIPR